MPRSIVKSTVKRASAGLPFNDGRAPGQAGPENDQQDQIAALDFAGSDRLAQGNRRRGRRSISIFMKVYKDLVRVCADAVGHRVHDATVGLVRNQALDL